MPRYRKQQDGEWVTPRRKGWLLKCCDCGLVHRVNFRLIPHGGGKRIQLQATRLKRPRKSEPVSLIPPQNQPEARINRTEWGG